MSNNSKNTRKIIGVILGGSVICLLGYFFFFNGDSSALKGLFNAAPRVEIKTTQAGGYTFYIKGKPTLLNGVNYNPTPIGKGYDYDFFADPNNCFQTIQYLHLMYHSN